MNIEIVKELARQWREQSHPEPADVEVMRAEDCPRDIRKIKEDEVRAEVFNQCAQDLEDVIRIFTEFKYKK